MLEWRSQNKFSPSSVAPNSIVTKEATSLPAALKYEHLNGLAQQPQGNIKLTERRDFFSITQSSKINEVTTAEHYLGWKLHLSVNPQQLQKAFNLAAPIISQYGFFFKVINLDNNYLGERFKEGMQITIPLEELENVVQSSDNVKKMMQEIEQKFLTNEISSGKKSASDAQTFSSYFSMRNDKVPNIVGKRAIAYISASAIGHNFNPANNLNPFENLLGMQITPFDPYQHFLSFDVDVKDYKALSCLQLTLFSYVREYTIFDAMNDQDKESFMVQFCLQQGKNVDAEFLKEIYRNNPRILLAVQQAFSLIFMREVDSSWTHGPYHEYVNSNQFSHRYPYDDSFKKLLVLVEQHSQAHPEMHQFIYEQPKPLWLDMYHEKTKSS